MKPTISLYHISGLLPAQYRNDPATKGIAFASHTRVKRQEKKKEIFAFPFERESNTTIIQTEQPEFPVFSLNKNAYTVGLSVLPVHLFVRLIRPIKGLNLGGIYLIYKKNAEEHTYSFSPSDEPNIPRWAIDPIDIYPGLELELKTARVVYDVKPGILKVRNVCIDDDKCNISVTDGEDWSYINDGELYLPTQESQGD